MQNNIYAELPSCKKPFLWGKIYILEEFLTISNKE